MSPPNGPLSSLPIQARIAKSSRRGASAIQWHAVPGLCTFSSQVTHLDPLPGSTASSQPAHGRRYQVRPLARSTHFAISRISSPRQRCHPLDAPRIGTGEEHPVLDAQGPGAVDRHRVGRRTDPRSLLPAGPRPVVRDAARPQRQESGDRTGLAGPAPSRPRQSRQRRRPGGDHRHFHLRAERRPLQQPPLAGEGQVCPALRDPDLHRSRLGGLREPGGNGVATRPRGIERARHSSGQRDDPWLPHQTVGRRGDQSLRGAAFRRRRGAGRAHRLRRSRPHVQGPQAR